MMHDVGVAINYNYHNTVASMIVAKVNDKSEEACTTGANKCSYKVTFYVLSDERYCSLHCHIMVQGSLNK